MGEVVLWGNATLYEVSVNPGLTILPTNKKFEVTYEVIATQSAVSLVVCTND